MTCWDDLSGGTRRLTTYVVCAAFPLWEAASIVKLEQLDLKVSAELEA